MVSQDFVTRLAARLAADPVITGICGNRVLDADYRLSGWNTAPVTVTDRDGIMLTTLALDDGGSVPPIFGGPDVAEHQTLYVWCFGNRSLVARNEISDVLVRVKSLLHNWQDPQTRATIKFSSRLGSVTADDGVYDRSTFRVSGIPLND